MQTVLITGGTGLVGKELTKHLSVNGYRTIILTRKMPDSAPVWANVEYALWDPNKQEIDIAAMQKADHIIHLAGAGIVDKRWTEAYKREIRDSRIESSALLIDALQKNSNIVKSFISASAIGWYGEDPAGGNHGFVETDPHAPGFLGETCKLWEESVRPAEQLGKRLIKLRLGIVLSNEGGAFIEFKRPVKFGVAGLLGNGKQVISWIHIGDLCRIFIAAIENERLKGVYNAVAPTPVTNEELMLELAQKLKGRFFIPLHVPPFVLKLMLGESSIEVLKSTTVSCEKLKGTGFTFLYPTISDAINALASTR